MVEHIVKEKRKNNLKGKRRDSSFLVHWVGEEEETWESWKDLRGTIQFKNFLENHPMKFYKKLAKKLNIEEFLDPSEGGPIPMEEEEY